jgi:hypothetical protein
VAGFGIILVALRHGLDWSDEAFVWTMIASDRVSAGEAWGFQHLLHPVFMLVGENVLAMRVLRLVGYVAVSGAVTWAAARVMAAAGAALTRREQWFVLFVAQAGTLLVWSYPPRYFGYNELSAWLSSLLCAALAVGLVPRTGDDRRLRALPWVAVGLLLLPLFMAKFTAALAWAALVGVLLLVPVPGTPRWLRLLAAGGGATLSLAVMKVLGVPFLTVARNAYGMLTNHSTQKASNHSISVILETYLTSTRTTARAAVLPILLLLALTLVCLLVRRRTVVGGVAALLVAAAFVAVQVPKVVEGTWPLLGSVAATLGLGGAMALVPAARATLPPKAPNRRLAVVLLLALATPLIAPVGTNNLIWGHTVFSATCWTVLFGLGMCLVARVASPFARVAPLLLGGAAVALTTTAVAYEVTVHPYRSYPLLEQDSTTSVPPLAGIRLTEDQATVANWLHSVAVEQRADGVPAVAMATPGYLFMFNRSGWASPWAGGIWQAAIARNCRREPPEDLFVIQPATPKLLIKTETKRLQTALTGCGLEFPADFTAVAERKGVIVWRLRAQPAG